MLFKFSPISIILWSWVLDEQISGLSAGLTAPSQLCRKLNPGLAVEGALITTQALISLQEKEKLGELDPRLGFVIPQPEWVSIFLNLPSLL